ncbi:isochorismatase family cysteine hydrolase [Phenylobacterium sp.]|uniref:isochorismatase family cysteine hydrolase n=1 Tax=Phenylobacterium sp. TaxID=1871053 RepID=UPI0027247621|nr:isochorismatase family cysteine hydrolase [Phenylobacterium sp.]MDO8379615.1 isochorismatase family cysteine hydrolase [Phenylobacterium sp.]
MEARFHDWHIEPREYARQEERRGRRHAYERIDPARTALLVIDMVPFFLNELPYTRGIVPNISRIADALRVAGGTVAWVLPTNGAPTRASTEFYGERVAAMYAASGGEGTLAERLWREFQVHEADVLAEKSATSAFFPGRSTLPPLLEARGIDTVLVTGTLSNICCESTARDASTLGLRVIMVADANAARRDQDHNAALYNVYRSFGDVRPTGEVLELIAPSAA